VTLLDLAIQATAAGATIAFALLHRAWYGPRQIGAIWAIVFGGLLASAIRLVLTYSALPGIRHWLLLDRDALRTLVAFGRWVFVSTVLAFVAGQSDRLIVGKLMSIEMLGVYGIAAMIAALPTQAVLRLGTAVVFPAYSRIATQGGLDVAFRRIRMPLLAAGAIMVVGMIVLGPWAVRFLYDPRYEEAGWILQFLAVMSWFQILESTTEAVLLATGRVRWIAAGNGAKLAAMIVLVPLGFHAWGFAGALTGLIAAELVRYLMTATAAAISGLRPFRLDAVFTALVATASLGGLLLLRTIHLRAG
jgi:O-antigen/teichoic acid export membrane protein